MQLRQNKIKWLSERVEDFPMEMLRDWYLDHYTEAGSATRRAKVQDFECLFEYFVLELGVQPYLLTLLEMSHEAIKGWRGWMADKGFKPSTINRRIATVRHFCRKIRDRVPFYSDPTENLKDFHTEATFKGIDEVDHEHLIEAAGRVGTSLFMNLRSQSIVMCALVVGLRVSSIRAAKLGNVSPCGQYFLRLWTKGGSLKQFYMRKDLQEVMKRYLVIRDAVLRDMFPKYRTMTDEQRGELPLFPTLARAVITKPDTMVADPKTIWKTFAETAKIADCKHINPHRFRHSFALNLLDDCKDVRLVAQALGHSDVRTTMRYTERRIETLAAAIEKGRKR